MGALFALEGSVKAVCWYGACLGWGPTIPELGMTLLRTPPPAVRKVLLHSHDSYGLGHLRRTLTLASAFQRHLPGVRVLITTGSPCATHFDPPVGVDLVKLPSVTKDEQGLYVPRTLGGGLEDLVFLRRRVLLEVYRAFAPDLVLADHQVLGLEGELTDLLEEARHRGTRTLLGIRDIIDSPEVVAREWGRPQIRSALAELYDRVVVYGSPLVFDTRTEYPIPPELGRRIEFSGYVSRPRGVPRARAVPSLRKQVLVTMGGGEDGAERVASYLDVVEHAGVGWDSTIVLGPLLGPHQTRKLKRRARLLPRVTVHHYHSDLPRLLAESDAVVAMAGYNTAAEVLRSGKPAVWLPRTFPRQEQAIRAARLEALGLGRSLVAPSRDEFAAAIEQQLATTLPLEACPPLEGAAALARMVGEMLEVPFHHENSSPVAQKAHA